MKHTFFKFVFSTSILIAIAAPSTAQYRTKAEQAAHGALIDAWANTCVSPCDIPVAMASGGTGADYVWAAYNVYSRGAEVRARNLAECISACTIFVDLVQKMGGRVCVDNVNRWRIHRSKIVDDDGNQTGLGAVPQYYSPGLAQWLTSAGGIPNDGSWIDPPMPIVYAAYGRCGVPGFLK